MKKILFIILILSLLIFSGCASETSDITESDTDDLGYVEDIDTELDTSDLDSLDEDLDLGWI